MSLALASVITIPDAKEYKVHLASWNQEDQPLEVFVRDREEWDDWNRWRSTKDQFNRPYIFSLIDFYPEPDIWLFGGIYRVLSRSPVSKALGYEIERVPATGPREAIRRERVCGQGVGSAHRGPESPRPWRGSQWAIVIPVPSRGVSFASGCKAEG